MMAMIIAPIAIIGIGIALIVGPAIRNYTEKKIDEDIKEECEEYEKRCKKAWEDYAEEMEKIKKSREEFKRKMNERK